MQADTVCAGSHHTTAGGWTQAHLLTISAHSLLGPTRHPLAVYVALSLARDTCGQDTIAASAALVSVGVVLQVLCACRGSDR